MTPGSCETVALGQILSHFEEFLGSHPEPTLLSLTERNGFVPQSDRFKKRLATADTSAYKVIRKGDIAFNPYLLWLGAIAQNVTWDKAIISPAYPTFRPSEKVAPRFLAHLLASDPMKLRYDAISFGSVPRRRRATVDDFLALKIRLPKLNEQHRIAEILDKSDELRRKREESIRLMDELLRSAFLDMFGDPVRNPKGWPLRKIGDLLLESPKNGLYVPASDYGSGTPIVRIDSFYAGEIRPIQDLKRVHIPEDLRRQFEVQENDILVNRVNSPKFLGKSALVPPLSEPTVFESNMMRLKLEPQVIRPGYAIFEMQQHNFRAQVQRQARDAVNQSSINQEDVRSFLLRVPPIPVQQAFIGVERRIRALILEAERAKIKTAVLFQSLVQRAFRGGL